MTTGQVIALGGLLLIALTTGVAWLLTEAVLATSTPIDRALPWTKHLQRLAEQAGVPDVRIYVRLHLPLEHKQQRVGAFASWSPSGPAVVLSPRVAVFATEAQLHFIFAHELGHIVLGHARSGFLRAACGYGYLFPRRPDTSAIWEQQADLYAAGLTGLPPSTLDGMR